jgi:hypothetical protein
VELRLRDDWQGLSPGFLQKRKSHEQVAQELVAHAVAKIDGVNRHGFTLPQYRCSQSIQPEPTARC